MPTETARLKLKKPLGNEKVSRAAYNENLDLIEQNAATRQEPELLSLDVFGTTGFVKSSTDFAATKNGVTPTQLDVTAGVAWLALAGGAGLRRFAQAATTFTTVAPSTTYYLDAQPDGTFSWGTTHSTQAGYLALCEVTNDGAGQILAVTDRRVVGKGPKAQAAGTSITDAGNYYTATDVEGALQEVGQPLNLAAPVNVLSNKAYLRAALEKIQNDRKAAQVPAVTIQGSTVVNLLGRDGNCEDITKWTTTGTGVTAAANTTNKVFGTQSMKITSSGASSTEHYTDSAPITLPNITGYYCLVGYSMAHAGRAALRVYKNSGTGNLDTGVVGVNSDSSKFVKTFAKFPTTDITAVQVRTQLLNAVGASVYTAAGENASFDGLMLLEITQAEYNDTNYEPPDFVESVQFLRNPAIKINGKNLLPDFTEWREIWGAYPKQILAPRSEKFVKNSTVNWVHDKVFLPIKENTTYTIKFDATVEGYGGTDGFYAHVNTYDKAGNLLSYAGVTTHTTSGTKTDQFVTPAGAVLLDIGFVIAANATGTFTFTNPSLVEGASALNPDEPNRDEQIVFPIALASGEKIEYANGKAVVTKNWQKDVVLDGSLGWTFNSDFAGYKRVLLLYSKPANLLSVMTKHDGKVMKLSITPGSDEFLLSDSNGDLYVGILDTDSGWGETYTPTADEIKAYFWGWKMNNGTFGTPYDGTGTKTWTKWNATDNTGALTVVPTYLADPLYTPYRLHYQLTQPKVYEILPQGGISLAEGVNQVEVRSGAVLGEVANPVFYVNSYFINSQGLPNRLKYSLQKFLRIYKNGIPDNDWVFSMSSPAIGSKEQASIAQAKFDPAAIYTVDYEVLPEAHNAQKQIVTLTDNGSLRDTVNASMRMVAEAQKDIAAVLQELLRRNPDLKNVSAFRAYQTVAQSLAAGIDAKLVYQVKGYDTLGEFDPATGRFTPKQAGLYLITAALTINPQINGNRASMRLFVNGADHSRMFNDTVSSVNDNTAIGSIPVWLNAGDYVEIMYYSANNASSAPGATLSYITGLRVA